MRDMSKALCAAREVVVDGVAVKSNATMLRAPWGDIPANDNHPQEDAFTPMTFVPAFDTPTTDVKAAIADEAKRIVTGDRRSAYGKPESNFARIAAYWNAYAQCKGWSVVFTAADVSPMMRGMKEARLCETPDHRDSFVDLCGYALTGAEVNRVAA